MSDLANPVFDWTLAYVADPERSADLYAKIFGVPATSRAPTFSMFALPNGHKLGFWLKDDVQPKATAAGGIEIAFAEATKEAVVARAADFRALGLTVLQDPVEMDFGFTFTATDPDGHRLRVFAPN